MNALRSASGTLPPSVRARNVTAILGPTNTGKTHLAIERMLGHKSGMIGLPLRLLAREVYNRVAGRAGEDAVALITGEEKIKPPDARYFVCTVEAMPLDVDVDFLAIDEIQLAADFDRGHIFTDRVLFRRAASETLLLGAATIRPLVESLVPGVNILARPRLSQLNYSGQTKLSRLPRRSAIVTFSASEVYALAELIRRQRGGAAVVIGALSPRTRNAQVALYEEGEVDYLVATDAIGMGLNLDINHVAFAANRKFDGHQYRLLNPAEIAQIAGRAGRHLRDGTFGVTGNVDPFDAELIERLEGHDFEPLKILQWRNPKLDFSSLASLKDSLAQTPSEPGLSRAPTASDEMVLDLALRDKELAALADNRDQVSLFWDTCQVPDYRKIAPAHHCEIVTSLFRHLATTGRIPDDWFATQVAYADRTDGDIDTLSNRISHVRTWTFVANRPDWLEDPESWQEQTRAIEDKLSDALHERLTQRFVDRRTSVLMRRLRDNDDLEIQIADDGAVKVENHYVGELKGFVFTEDSDADGKEGKALRAAAAKALVTEIANRAAALAAAKDEDIALTNAGDIVWNGDTIGRLTASDQALQPRIQLSPAEQLQAADRERIVARLETWLQSQLQARTGPLLALAGAEGLSGIPRGIAFRLAEGFGSIARRDVHDDMRNITKEERAALRKFGVRFGAHAIYVPDLLKPAGADMIRLLWYLQNQDSVDLSTLPSLATQGLMSVIADPAVPNAYYAAVGYHIHGNRAVRVDMLERLADEIRAILSWAAEGENTQAPEGWHAKGQFVATPKMMSLIGAGAEDLAPVLRALGFHGETSPAPPSPEPKTAHPDAAESETAESSVAPAAPIAASNNVEPEEPATITIWRVARKSRPSGKPRAPRKQTSAKGRKPADSKRNQKPPRPKPRQPDPNSPFAALAGLKKELQTKPKTGKPVADSKN